MRDAQGDLAYDSGIREVEMSEIAEIPDSKERTFFERVVGKVETSNGGDAEEGWHDLARDASAAEIERDDQTGSFVAGDPLPSAAVGAGKPRRERSG